jgi:prepilin-type N-terminal cleavage/methylation domain-containing protein
MRSERGFTLIELAVTVALIGVVAAIAAGFMPAARRNATVVSTAWELGIRLKSLRARALGDQRDLVFVAVDAKDNDASACNVVWPERCARWFLLAPRAASATAGTPAWTFAAFDPATPAANADVVDQALLPRGIRLYKEASVVGTSGPAPFDSARILDTTLTRGCGASGALCVAIRYSRDGVVQAEPPTSTAVAALGVGITLGSDLKGPTSGADVRAVLVGFPSGIVRSYGVAP